MGRNPRKNEKKWGWGHIGWALGRGWGGSRPIVAGLSSGWGALWRAEIPGVPPFNAGGAEIRGPQRCTYNLVTGLFLWWASGLPLLGG